MVDLQETQSELILLLAVGFVLDEEQPFEGEHHGLEGRFDGLGILVDGEDDLRDIDGEGGLLDLLGLLDTADLVDYD